MITDTEIVEIVGDYDVDRVKKAFMYNEIGEAGYTEETFMSHLQALAEHGEGYINFVETLAANPAALSFVILSGPDGIYNMLSMMGSAGILDKKAIASTAGLSRGKPWFKIVYSLLAERAYENMHDIYKDIRNELLDNHKELEDLETLEDFLLAIGRATIFSKVGTLTHPQTNRECATALGFRLDVHSEARNGRKDDNNNEG